MRQSPARNQSPTAGRCGEQVQHVLQFLPIRGRFSRGVVLSTSFKCIHWPLLHGTQAARDYDFFRSVKPVLGSAIMLVSNSTPDTCRQRLHLHTMVPLDASQHP